MKLVKTGKDPQTGRVSYISDTTFKILLVGSRGVGKTSLIASMKHQIDNFGLSGFFYAVGETANALTFQCDEMQKGLKGKIGDFRGIQGINKTSDRYIYKFEIQANYDAPGKLLRFCFPVEIIDLPGGWYTESHDSANTHKDAIRSLLSETIVSLVCVNTPSLMDGRPEVFARFNSPTIVSGWYQNDGYLQKLKETDHKVIFVLSRCEKYREQRQEMQERVKTAKYAYAGLIAGMSAMKIPVSLTYVETLGGVEFDHFDEQEQNKWQEKSKITGSYSPKNCEVPLILALRHAVESIHSTLETNNGNWIERLKNVFGLCQNDLAQIAISEINTKLQQPNLQEGDHYWSLTDNRKEKK